MDLSITYLGQVDMTRSTEMKAEDKFPITVQGYTKGKLLDGTECDVLVDTGASKSYMSKSYFLRCIKFTLITQIYFYYYKKSSR